MRGGAINVAIRSPRLARATFITALAVYAVGLLWPFTLEVPTWVANGAVWTGAGTLRFEQPGLAVSHTSPSWQAASRELGYFEVSLRVRALSPQQDGPARLFTLARDTYGQNVLIGQVGDDVVARLPMRCHSDEAESDACQKQLRLRGVFATSAWVDVELTVEPGRVILRAAGDRAVEVRLADQPLRRWRVSDRLALGNDVSGLRPWLGELQRVTVTTPLGSEDWLQPDRFELPRGFWLLDRQPKLVPFERASSSDLILNLLLYAPMAIIISRCLKDRRVLLIIKVALATFIISGFFELMQLFVSTRNTSVTDVILNTTGAAVAVGLLCMFVGERRS